MLLKSMKAIMKAGGTRSGNSYQASDVTKLFVKTSLLSVILQLMIVVYNCLVFFDVVDIDREIQLIMTVHVIPGVTTLNTCCTLTKLVKANLHFKK